LGLRAPVPDRSCDVSRNMGGYSPPLPRGAASVRARARVPIEDQFGCQASVCHLDVFTAARIIHATLCSRCKPRARSASGTRRTGGGGGGERREREREERRQVVQEKRGLTAAPTRQRERKRERGREGERDALTREKPSVHATPEGRHRLFKTLRLLSALADSRPTRRDRRRHGKARALSVLWELYVTVRSNVAFPIHALVRERERERESIKEQRRDSRDTLEIGPRRSLHALA